MNCVPPPTMTCNSANILDRKANGIFWRRKINVCRFSELMEQLGKDQMRRAIAHIPGADRNLVEVSFSRIIKEWTDLTGEGHERLDCGFDPKYGPTKKLSDRTVRDPVRCMTPESPTDCTKGSGFIDRCDWWCDLSNHIENFGQGGMVENSKYVMKQTLDKILGLTNEYFSRNHAEKFGNDPNDRFRLNMCERIPHDAKDYPGQMKNRDGNDCRVTDKCGQAVRYIYREVAKFEPLVGSIGKLSSYQESWRNDRDA